MANGLRFHIPFIVVILQTMTAFAKLYQNHYEIYLTLSGGAINGKHFLNACLGRKCRRCHYHHRHYKTLP